MKNEKCRCREIVGYFGNRPLLIHLLGCTDSEEAREYDVLPWYRKMFAWNPHRWYRRHLRTLED